MKKSFCCEYAEQNQHATPEAGMLCRYQLILKDMHDELSTPPNGKPDFHKESRISQAIGRIELLQEALSEI